MVLTGRVHAAHNVGPRVARVDSAMTRSLRRHGRWDRGLLPVHRACPQDTWLESPWSAVQRETGEEGMAP
jgi:hypothetical protein